MRYKLLLWDFDGTIADTLPAGVPIFNALAAKYGFRPAEDMQALRGLTMTELFRTHEIPLARAPLILRDFFHEQRRIIANVPLIAGLAPVLHELHRRGHRMAIVSSNTDENIRPFLAARQVADCFEHVVGYSRLLGKHRAIRRLVRRLGIAPAHVLYIGDEIRDIEAARLAGIPMAAVTWGFNSREALAAHQPDCIVERPDQLLEIISAPEPPS